jgi:hypothetical protein
MILTAPASFGNSRPQTDRAARKFNNFHYLRSADLPLNENSRFQSGPAVSSWMNRSRIRISQES